MQSFRDTSGGLSTTYSVSATHSWEGKGNWSLTGTTASPSLPHYDFAVDTRNYNFVRIAFQIRLEGTGDWASNNNPVHVYTSRMAG